MKGERDAGEVSRILRAVAEGRAADLDALLPLVYDELHGLAQRRMAGERKGHTLQPSALVNEAWLRLVGAERFDWSCRARFYAAAAEAMRRILIDHARARGSAKRGGGRVRVPIDAVDLAAREDPAEILSVDEALSRLSEQDGRMAEVVKLRFYAGLTEAESAEALGVSERTVRRAWILARAWLHRELGG